MKNTNIGTFVFIATPWLGIDSPCFGQRITSWIQISSDYVFQSNE